TRGEGGGHAGGGAAPGVREGEGGGAAVSAGFSGAGGGIGCWSGRASSEGGVWATARRWASSPPLCSMVRMAWGVRRRRTGLPRASLISRVDCRFGMKRRFVLLLAWLTRCPVWTPLPEIEQRRDMAESSRKSRKRGNVGPGRG